MANQKKNFFERFSNFMTQFTGSSTAFFSAVLIVIIWAVTGPIFKYSETWQLVINTGTTIITFLMVFLIQKAQNKDGKAIQLKLNELLAATQGASNRMVNIEDLNEDELDKLHRFYKKLADLESKSQNLGATHSIDAAEKSHNKKNHIQSKKEETDSKKIKLESKPKAKPVAKKT